MRIAFVLTLVATACMAARPAQACGGGFGEDLEVQPDQTIVLTHDGAVQSYLFQPELCGPPGEFGLIVPIPGALTEDPDEVDDVLYAELDDLSEPRVEVEEVCEDSDGNGALAGGVPGGAGRMGGVDVISEGEVGIFEWVQLDASSVSAFTDWLDERSFPYEPEATDAFEHYVDAGWKFVAFTVDASEMGEQSGADELCGTFGPIRMAFASEQPVVPVRIAASDGDSLYRTFTWQVFAVASEKLRPVGIEVHRQEQAGEAGDGVSGAAGGSDAGFLDVEELFAGELDATTFERYRTLAELASEGDWVTAFEMRFEGIALTDDFHFEPAPEQAPFQRVEYDTVYVSCSGDGGDGRTGGVGSGGDGGSGDGGGGGCAVAAPTGGSGDGASPWLALVAAALWFARRRRRVRRIAAAAALLALVACGGGGDDGDGGDGDGDGDEGQSCPAIACFPMLTVQLEPGLDVGSYAIDYTADGREVSCTLELQSLATPINPGGAAGAPAGIGAPMMETDCDELIFAFDVESGRVASFALGSPVPAMPDEPAAEDTGPPAALDVELRDGSGAVLASGSFQPNYDEEDDGGCGCGGASVTLELTP